MTSAADHMGTAVIRTPMKLMTIRFDDMIKARQSWIGHYRELQQYILPRRGRWLAQDRNDGSKKNGSIINDTGTTAHRTLKDNIFAGTCNPARRWFRLVPPIPSLKDDAEVQEYLHNVETVMYEIFERSNFYNSIASVYEEQTLFGTAAMMIEPNFDNVIQCRVFTAGQYAIDVDANGKPNAFVREFDITYDQMVEMFGTTGNERVSDAVEAAWKRGDLESTRTIRHLIEPIDSRYTLLGTQPGHRWRSAYWDPAEKGPNERFLRTSGYFTRPLVTPRWETLDDDPYGRSPAMDALPTIKGANQLEEDIAFQVEMVGQPPQLAHPSMKNEPLSSLPASITFGSHMAPGMPAMQPSYQIDPRVGEMEQRLERMEDRIRKTMYSDLFLLMSQSMRQQTATEVAEKAGEKIQALTNVLERQRTELLDDCVDITYTYGFNAEIFPDAPPQMQGTKLKVEYISSLAQAMRAIQTQAMDRVIEATGMIVEVTQDPTVGLKLDGHQIVDEYHSLMGTPPKMIRSDEDVERLIANQKKRQAQQEQAAAAGEAANTAKTASETHLKDGSSALDRVVEGLSQ